MPTSLITDFQTLILIVEVVASSTKGPRSEPWRDSQPAQGFPACSAVNFATVAEVLKQKFPGLKVFAVEPELSPVLSGGTPGPHPLQGIGAGFVPSILNKGIIDGVIQVSKDEAFSYAQRFAKEEGILAGISTGASLAAVAKKLPELPAGSRVLTYNYDTGERYLSIEGLF